MTLYADTLWCDGCGVEIHWKPLEKSQLIYCCQRCLIGEECVCDGYHDEYPPNLARQESSYSQTGAY